MSQVPADILFAQKASAVAKCAGMDPRNLSLERFRTLCPVIFCRAYSTIYKEKLNYDVNENAEAAMNNVIENLQTLTTVHALNDITGADVCTGSHRAIGVLVGVLFAEGQRAWLAKQDEKRREMALMETVKESLMPGKEENFLTQQKKKGKVFRKTRPGSAVPTKPSIVESYGPPMGKDGSRPRRPQSASAIRTRRQKKSAEVNNTANILGSSPTTSPGRPGRTTQGSPTARTTENDESVDPYGADFENEERITYTDAHNHQHHIDLHSAEIEEVKRKLNDHEDQNPEDVKKLIARIDFLETELRATASELKKSGSMSPNKAKRTKRRVRRAAHEGRGKASHNQMESHSATQEDEARDHVPIAPTSPTSRASAPSARNRPTSAPSTRRAKGGVSRRLYNAVDKGHQQAGSGVRPGSAVAKHADSRRHRSKSPSRKAAGRYDDNGNEDITLNLDESIEGTTKKEKDALYLPPAPESPREKKYYTYDTKSGRRREMSEYEVEEAEKRKEQMRIFKEEQAKLNLLIPSVTTDIGKEKVPSPPAGGTSYAQRRKLEIAEQIKASKGTEYVPPEPTRPEWPSKTTERSVEQFIEAQVIARKGIDVHKEKKKEETVKRYLGGSHYNWVYGQASDYDLVLSVEICHSCQYHASSLRHNPMDYVNKANAVLQHLCKLAHDSRIAMRVGVCRIDTDITGDRVGAFEVQCYWQGTQKWPDFIPNIDDHEEVSRFKGKNNDKATGVHVLHSKLATKNWPSKKVLEQRMTALLSQISEHRPRYDEIDSSDFEGEGTDGSNRGYPLGEVFWEDTEPGQSPQGAWMPSCSMGSNPCADMGISSKIPLGTSSKKRQAEAEAQAANYTEGIYWVYDSRNALVRQGGEGMQLAIKELSELMQCREGHYHSTNEPTDFIMTYMKRWKEDQEAFKEQQELAAKQEQEREVMRQAYIQDTPVTDEGDNGNKEGGEDGKADNDALEGSLDMGGMGLAIVVGHDGDGQVSAKFLVDGQEPEAYVKVGDVDKNEETPTADAAQEASGEGNITTAITDLIKEVQADRDATHEAVLEDTTGARSSFFTVGKTPPKTADKVNPAPAPATTTAEEQLEKTDKEEKTPSEKEKRETKEKLKERLKNKHHTPEKEKETTSAAPAPAPVEKEEEKKDTIKAVIAAREDKLDAVIADEGGTRSSFFSVKQNGPPKTSDGVVVTQAEKHELQNANLDDFLGFDDGGSTKSKSKKRNDNNNNNDDDDDDDSTMGSLDDFLAKKSSVMSHASENDVSQSYGDDFEN